MSAVAQPLPYPPPFTHRQTTAWVISAYTEKAVLPGVGTPPADLRMQRLVERHVEERRHREQLKAWCRGQGEEMAFRASCRDRGWNRDTAQRNVDKALAMIFLVMCLDRGPM